MKVVAAYLLAVLGGNSSPSPDEIKNILGSDDMKEFCTFRPPQTLSMTGAHGLVLRGLIRFEFLGRYVVQFVVHSVAYFLCSSMEVGAEADDDRIELLLSEVSGKDITELIAAGREKLASVPAGGGGGVAVSAAAPSSGAGGAAAAPAAESKKEEKVEEKEESDDVRTFLTCMSDIMFVPVHYFSVTWVSVSLTRPLVALAVPLKSRL
ncbi:Large ribosomal subunit protein P2B-like protein [Drosera capensis]